MTYLYRDGQIPEDDLPRSAKSRHTTSRDWPSPATSITVICSRYDNPMPELSLSPKSGIYEFSYWCHRQRGFDESSSLFFHWRILFFLPRSAALLRMLRRLSESFYIFFFGGLECVGHSYAYVAHFLFLRDVWIRI
jgi:hypothetical protein